jgi:hypothetical protein
MKLMDMIMNEINKDRPENEQFVRLHSEQGKYDNNNRLHRLNGQFAKTAKSPADES